MLEIGIENKFSLNLWLEYFPKSFIYGMDINKEEIGSRYHIIKSDQSKIEDLNKALQIIKHPLFLIIDDGSHIPEHQLLTFNTLFNYLEPGGTYIIEDIETSYWSKNGLYGYSTQYGFKHKNSLIEIFKNLLDDINSHFLTIEIQKIQDSILEEKLSKITRNNISNITFAHNTIIITKKTITEIECRDNKYYWFQNL